MARIIPSLLLRGGRLVKGVRFADHRDAGRPDTTARAHDSQKADEIAALDIDASKLGREPDYAAFAAIADAAATPLTVGGGVRSEDIARRCMDAGADKLALTTAALDTPGLIDRLARRFGAQAVVIGLDIVKDDVGHRRLFDHRRGAPSASPLDWRAWAAQAVDRGAGEIRLLSVDREGRRIGFDLELFTEARAALRVPIVLEGGAGGLPDLDAAMRAGAEDLGLGTLLVFSDNNIRKIKSFLANSGHVIRL